MRDKRFELMLLCGIMCSLLGCENTQRSMVFFTATTVGVEIAVEPNSTTPAKFIVGFKRAEGLMDPVLADGVVTYTDKSGNVVPKYGYSIKDNPHSVLAKMVGDVQSGLTGNNKTSMSGGQWFASGKAAELLAEHPSTAAALTSDPEIAKQAAEIAKAFNGFKGENRTATVSLIYSIYDLSKEIVTNPPSPELKKYAKQVVGKLDSVGNLVDAPKIRYYKALDPDGAGPLKTKLTEEVNAISTIDGLSGYGRLTQSVKYLEESISSIDKAIRGAIHVPNDASSPVHISGVGPAPAQATAVQIAKLIKIRTETQNVLDKLYQSLSTNDDIISAVQLYYNNILFKASGSK